MKGMQKFRSGLLTGLTKHPKEIFGINVDTEKFMDLATRKTIPEVKKLKKNTFFQSDDPSLELEDRVMRHMCIVKVETFLRLFKRPLIGYCFSF